jgi:ATP-dependent Clp protease ATP-binding subunit ClpC
MEGRRRQFRRIPNGYIGQWSWRPPSCAVEWEHEISVAEKVSSIMRQPTALGLLKPELKYERPSDAAEKVMQLANQEAQRFNHEYIGTEHVLLGLIREGSGAAASVLKNLDVDRRRIRLEVEKLVQCGPDMIVMGKRPQTPRAISAIEYSKEEACNLNHDYIGTEHILLGLLREQEGVATQVLMNFGLTVENTRQEVLRVLAGTAGLSN